MEEQLAHYTSFLQIQDGDQINNAHDFQNIPASVINPVLAQTKSKPQTKEVPPMPKPSGPTQATFDTAKVPVNLKEETKVSDNNGFQVSCKTEAQRSYFKNWIMTQFPGINATDFKEYEYRGFLRLEFLKGKIPQNIDVIKQLTETLVRQMDTPPQNINHPTVAEAAARAQAEAAARAQAETAARAQAETAEAQVRKQITGQEKKFLALVGSLQKTKDLYPKRSDVYTSVKQLKKGLKKAGKEFFENPSQVAFIKFKDVCTNLMNTAKMKLAGEPSAWEKVNSVIKGILGILAALTVIPGLIVLGVTGGFAGYTDTFFRPAINKASVQETVKASEKSLEEENKIIEQCFKNGAT